MDFRCNGKDVYCLFGCCPLAIRHIICSDRNYFIFFDMTNEQKATEIAMCHFPTHETADAESIRFGALQMAEWKDEQHSKEKQQLIDKACDWLKDDADEGIASYSNIFINNFKKAIENRTMEHISNEEMKVADYINDLFKAWNLWN